MSHELGDFGGRLLGQGRHQAGVGVSKAVGAGDSGASGRAEASHHPVEPLPFVGLAGVACRREYELLRALALAEHIQVSPDQLREVHRALTRGGLHVPAVCGLLVPVLVRPDPEFPHGEVHVPDPEVADVADPLPGAFRSLG